MTMPELTVPDPVMLEPVQRLCEWDRPYSNSVVCDQIFVEGMRAAVTWHQNCSPFYRKLLEYKGFRPEHIDTIADCGNVPFVLANFFKTHELKSVPEDKIQIHLTSSGTTGQKSQMFFDHWSLGCAQRMVDWIFQHYGWITEQKSNYLLYSYEQAPGMKLGTAYTDNFLCKYAPANEVFSAIRYVDQEKHEFDPFGCISVLQRYEEQGLPVRIFGFPAFLYFTLERMRKLGVPPIKLAQDSLVFLGGGWKGNQEKAISKYELYSQVTEQLGIPDERIRDGFGSVEHCIPYVECGYHNFHVPVYSRVFIRDVKNLKPMGYGAKGFLHFVSPYITSVPAISVLMGDLAALYPGAECGCGLETPYFIIHGRAGVSKNKSCAVAAAELLKEQS